MQNAQTLKRVLYWTVAAAMLLGFTSSSAQETHDTAKPDSNAKKKVVIIVERPHPSVIRIDGFDMSEYTDDVIQAQIQIAASIHDWVRDGLSKFFEFPDRNLLDQIFAEIELDKVFNKATETAKQLNLQGADLLVVIRPSEIVLRERTVFRVQKEVEARVSFTARVVRVSDGNILNLGSSSFEGEDKSSAVSLPKVGEGIEALLGLGTDAYKMLTRAGKRAVQKFVFAMVEKVLDPLPARVLHHAAESSTYILNLGKNNGIVEGIHLKLERVEEIPLEGGKTHRRTREIGIVQVTSVDDETCEVKVVGNPREPLQVGMQLQCRFTQEPESGRSGKKK